MDPKETPLTKYLASLDSKPTDDTLTPEFVKPHGRLTSVKQKFNFEDDSFFDNERSLLHISPSHSNKRARTSLFDYLDKSDTNNISELEKLLRQAQAELIDSKALNTNLEYQIIELKKAHGERLIELEKKSMEEKKKCKNAISDVEQMKEEVEKLKTNEVKMLDAMAECQRRHAAKESALQKTVSELRHEHFKIKQELDQEKLKLSDTIRKVSSDLSETEVGAEKWIMESQILRDQLVLKDEQIKKYREQLKSAHQVSKPLVDENSPSKPEAELLERIKKFENLYVKEQNENYRLKKAMDKMNDQNKLLKTTMNTEMLMQEKLNSLQNELEAAQEAVNEKGKLLSEKEMLFNDLNLWKNTCSRLDSTLTSPYRLESFIRKMQNSILELRNENSSYKFQTTALKTTIAKNEGELNAMKLKLQQQKETEAKLESEHKKISYQLLLITKDRDSLQELNQSYGEEYSSVNSAPLNKRIDVLQHQVASYEAFLTAEARKCSECERKNATILSLETELKNASKPPYETKSTGTSEDTSSEDVEDGVKILSFGKNPSTLSMERRVGELLSENEKLKEKIKSLEDRSVLLLPMEEKDRLEEQLKSLELRHQRLSDAYDYETQQLQSAISKIFGFHIILTRTPQPQIRLQSIYSNGSEDAFVFQEAENDDMMLLDTPVLSQFRELIDRYLLQEASIPGFISSVTIAYMNPSSSQGQSDYNASNMPSSQESTNFQNSENRRSHFSSDIVEVSVARNRSSSDEESDHRVEYEDYSESEAERGRYLSDNECYQEYEDHDSDPNGEDNGEDEEDDDVIAIED